jgi:hypothetical protein
LCFSKEVDGNIFGGNSLVICAYSIGLVFSKNVVLKFCNIFVVGASQKTLFLHPENGK